MKISDKNGKFDDNNGKFDDNNLKKAEFFSLF